MYNSIKEILKDTKIYVVHALNGYEFHENHVKTLFKQYDLNFEFVTDGDPTLTTTKRLDQYFFSNFIATRSKGGISCTLNHFYSYKKFIESNKKYAIIFENDPIFFNNFKSKLINIFNNIGKLKAGYIISIENTTLEFPSFFQTKKGKLFYKAKSGRMAGAYIIDKTGAKNIINSLEQEKCNDIYRLVSQ